MADSTEDLKAAFEALAKKLDEDPTIHPIDLWALEASPGGVAGGGDNG